MWTGRTGSIPYGLQGFVHCSVYHTTAVIGFHCINGDARASCINIRYDSLPFLETINQQDLAILRIDI